MFVKISRLSRSMLKTGYGYCPLCDIDEKSACHHYDHAHLVVVAYRSADTKGKE
jgi:hypothetical protein